MIRYRERYQPDARFSTWLFTITRSVCIDTIRRTSKIPPVMSFETSKPEGVSFTETLTAAQMTPRDHLHEDDLQRKIDRTLQTLPEEQREVLLLRELTDLTFAEIARITGCSSIRAKSGCVCPARVTQRTYGTRNHRTMNHETARLYMIDRLYNELLQETEQQRRNIFSSIPNC